MNESEEASRKEMTEEVNQLLAKIMPQLNGSNPVSIYITLMIMTYEFKKVYEDDKAVTAALNEAEALHNIVCANRSKTKKGWFCW